MASRKIGEFISDDFVGYYDNYVLCQTNALECLTEWGGGIEFLLPSLHVVLPKNLTPYDLLLVYCVLQSIILVLIFVKICSSVQSEIKYLILSLFLLHVSVNTYLGSQLIRQYFSVLLILLAISYSSRSFLIAAMIMHLSSIISIIIAKTFEILGKINIKYTAPILLIFTVLIPIFLSDLVHGATILLQYNNPIFSKLYHGIIHYTDQQEVFSIPFYLLKIITVLLVSVYFSKPYFFIGGFFLSTMEFIFLDFPQLYLRTFMIGSSFLFLLITIIIYRQSNHMINKRIRYKSFALAGLTILPIISMLYNMKYIFPDSEFGMFRPFYTFNATNSIIFYCFSKLF